MPPKRKAVVVDLTGDDAEGGAAAAPVKAAKAKKKAPKAESEEEEDNAAAAPVKAKKAKKAKLPPSVHAGPDTSEMVAGPFLPAATMDAFVATLPPRPAGACVKVVSYNVNGLRAAIKGDRGIAFRAWLAAEDPDVLCLQEVKADADAIKKEKLSSLFPSLPHAVFAPGDPTLDNFKKGYAGVAIFSKVKPLNVTIGLGDEEHDGTGRLITAVFEWGVLVNAYVPNSGAKLEKLQYRTTSWDPVLRTYLKSVISSSPGGAGRALLVGDLNVAFSNGDVDGWKDNYRNTIAGFCDGFVVCVGSDVRET